MPTKQKIYELMHDDLHKLLDEIRDKIIHLSNDDPDLLFYSNRFIYARLQLDERRNKAQIKKHLYDRPNGKICIKCKQKFTTLKDVHLHRTNDSRGYFLENCILLHKNCHVEIHCPKDSKDNTINPIHKNKGQDNEMILSKYSKKFSDQKYRYWWDITPAIKFNLESGKYSGIKFFQKDTGFYCLLDSTTLLNTHLLDSTRQTSRGDGNWGVKVMKGRKNKLTFEPKDLSHKEILVDVVWQS